MDFIRVIRCLVVMFLFTGVSAKAADNSISIQRLGQGWIGLTKQLDPFEKSKVEVSQISKSGFIFRCGELNMRVRSYGFEGLSFSAAVKYMIDDKEPVEKRGRFSTYLGGSDMVTDSRYFSFKLSDLDVDSMKAGTIMKVAGKFSDTGWQTKKVSLMGFTSAYNTMCE